MQVEIEREPEQDGETSSRGFLQTEDTRGKAVPKWSDVFGDNKATASNSGSSPIVKEQPQELAQESIAKLHETNIGQSSA